MSSGSESDDENIFGDDGSGQEIDENILGELEQDLDRDGQPSDQDEESDTEDSDSAGDDDDDDEDEESQRPPPPPPISAPPAAQLEPQVLVDTSMAMQVSPPTDTQYPVHPSPRAPSSREASPFVKAASPTLQARPPSPAGLRKLQILKSITHWPRSFTVEAICAIPHPAPTHSLAASLCMTHLITGSEDGYIRDYDIFSGLNGKVLLSAPQRHHCGVMEGVIKAAQFRYWWENPSDPRNHPGSGMGLGPADEVSVCQPYSMLMHSDALWSLAGTDEGHINLFTVRHQPGTLIHTMYGHSRRPVSAMAMRHDEKGFYSAGWDGEAHEWDLNTGQVVRSYTAHPSQLVAVAVRPIESDYTGIVPWVGQPRVNITPSASWNQTRSHSQSQSQFQFQPPEDVKMYSMDPSEEPSELAVKQEPQPFPPPPPQQTDVLPPPPQQDDDTKSDTSFDPLFDEAEGDMADDNFPTPTQQSQPQPQPQPHAPNPPPPPEPITTQLSMPGPGLPSLPSARLPPAPAPAPKNAPPILDPLSYTTFSPDVLLTASIDGQVMLWDRRVHSPGRGVGRLWMSEKTPPWCVSACWSADGSQVYAGRRNGTVDVWDVRMGVTGGEADGMGMGMGMEGQRTPRVLKVIRNPPSSGVVSYVCAFPDGRHIACASTDNIRLWNVAEAGEPDAVSGRMKSGVQFKIIPGHHGGTISQLLVDKQGRFLVSASSNRGWFGESSKTVFIHDIKKNW